MLISRAPFRFFLWRREPLFISQLQWAEWNVLSTLHTASQGWMLVSPQVPSLWPTLERHSSGRQNKRLLIAGAFCLLSKMNQTLQKLVFNNTGCAVSPYHIPHILPPPTQPQALHYSDSFYSLISTSWRLPGPARQDRCPGTGPAGQLTSLSWGERWGTGGRLPWRTGSAGFL